MKVRVCGSVDAISRLTRTKNALLVRSSTLKCPRECNPSRPTYTSMCAYVSLCVCECVQVCSDSIRRPWRIQNSRSSTMPLVRNRNRPVQFPEPQRRASTSARSCARMPATRRRGARESGLARFKIQIATAEKQAPGLSPTSASRP